MATKIAVTAQNRKTISSHAGACRNYYIYTVDDNGKYEKELVELAKDESLRYTFHDDTSENPTNYIFGMDILLTGGLGQGAVMKLAAKGVKAYVVQETDPDTAVQKLLDNTLMVFAPSQHHHGHKH